MFSLKRHASAYAITSLLFSTAVQAQAPASDGVKTSMAFIYITFYRYFRCAGFYFSHPQFSS